MGIFDQLLEPAFRQPASCQILLGSPAVNLGPTSVLVMSVEINVNRFDAATGSLVIEDRRNTDGS